MICEYCGLELDTQEKCRNTICPLNMCKIKYDSGSGDSWTVVKVLKTNNQLIEELTARVLEVEAQVAKLLTHQHVIHETSFPINNEQRGFRDSPLSDFCLSYPLCANCPLKGTEDCK